MASTTHAKRTAPPSEKRTDNHTELCPPLDYSFHNARQLEEAVAEPRVCPTGPKLIKDGDRYRSHGINLNHNALNGPLETLPDFVRTILVNPNALSTLDLSFNVFTEIPAVVTQFPSLKCFYFHKNMVSDMTEVQKLASLKELKYLTLHGNPIEITVPFLRSYVLCLLPGLRSLNCTPVTKDLERMASNTPSPSTSASSTSDRQRVRLQRDFEHLRASNLPFLRDIQLETVDGALQLTGVLYGPENSDYAGGQFHFRLHFITEFPFKAPVLCFTTPIRHPNVDSRDKVACNDQLVANWMPTMSLVEVLTHMHELLASPNYDAPVEGDTGVEKTPQIAREWTQLYARPQQ